MTLKIEQKARQRELTAAAAKLPPEDQMIPVPKMTHALGIRPTDATKKVALGLPDPAKTVTISACLEPK
jgi:hypothetical protein